MKRQKRGKRIVINLTNRWLYTFIFIGIMILAAVGVYAATYAASGAGHNSNEIDFSGGITTAPILKTTGATESLAQSFYDMAANHFGANTIYSYDKICVGNSYGSCTGTGGTVITSSGVTVNGVALGSGGTTGITSESDPYVPSWVRGTTSVPHAKGGLYGYCVVWANIANQNCNQYGVRSPAYCNTNKRCYCTSGYTPVPVGESHPLGHDEYYFSCIKD